MNQFKIEPISFYESNDFVIIKFETLTKYDSILSHAFTTRIGGKSLGHLAGSNFGLISGDQKENVIKNTNLLAKALNIDPRVIVRTKQLHSNTVLDLDSMSMEEYYSYSMHKPVDGLITNTKKHAILGIFADCVPIYLFDPISKSVGLVHSGWRGTVDKIALHALDLMVNNGSRPRDIIAVIGPAIDKCCFETGAEVVEQLKNAYSSVSNYVTPIFDKYMLDLKNLIAHSLADSGLLYDNITVSDLCTCCRQDLFYSHRGSKGKTGRMAGIIKLNGEC